MIELKLKAAVSLILCLFLLIQIMGCSSIVAPVNNSSSIQESFNSYQLSSETQGIDSEIPPNKIFVSEHLYENNIIVRNAQSEDIERSEKFILKDNLAVGLVEKGKYTEGSNIQGKSIYFQFPGSKQDEKIIIHLQDVFNGSEKQSRIYLNGVTGIFESENENEAEFILQVIAGGEKLVSTDDESTILFETDIGHEFIEEIDVAMGIWPLRKNFYIEIHIQPKVEGAAGILILENFHVEIGNPYPALGISTPQLLWAGLSSDIPSDIPATIEGMTRLNPSFARAGSIQTEGKVFFNGIKIAEQLHKHGIPILWNMNQDSADYSPEVREQEDFLVYSKFNSYGVPRISQINEQLFKERLEAYFKVFAYQGICPAVLEVGNELDWGPFNGDINPDDPTSTNIAESAKGYARMLMAAHEVRNQYCPDMDIITFGAANIPDSWSMYKIDPIEFLKMTDTSLMENYGLKLSDIVQGIGIHLYYTPFDREELFSIINKYEEIRTDFQKYWVTEWSFPKSSIPLKGRTGVSYDDNQIVRYSVEMRLKAFMDFLDAVNSTRYPFGSLIHYSYDSITGNNIYDIVVENIVEAEDYLPEITYEGSEMFRAYHPDVPVK